MADGSDMGIGCTKPGPETGDLFQGAGGRSASAIRCILGVIWNAGAKRRSRNHLTRRRGIRAQSRWPAWGPGRDPSTTLGMTAPPSKRPHAPYNLLIQPGQPPRPTTDPAVLWPRAPTRAPVACGWTDARGTGAPRYEGQFRRHLPADAPGRRPTAPGSECRRMIPRRSAVPRPGGRSEAGGNRPAGSGRPAWWNRRGGSFRGR